MASGKSSKRARTSRSVSVSTRTIPWGTIIASLVVVLFAAAVLGYAMVQSNHKKAEQSAMAEWTPSDSNHDPSKAIPGVVTQEFPGGQHVTPAERVAYTHSPPFGGAHDYNWAACSGVVYPKPVRNENMVHALEHGTVWIAYDPAKITGEALASLTKRVQGQPYTMISPYPGLDQPIALSAWGHQLKLSDPGDPRIGEFIHSLRSNQYTPPEPGASCDALGKGQFDQDNPPPFDPSKPGPGATPENGKGTPASNEMLQQPAG